MHLCESDFRELWLVPARVVLDRDYEDLAVEEGVYYVFFARGIELLNALSFFDYCEQRPMMYRDWAHLYTGCSQRMRQRAIAHLRGTAHQSPLRKTLIAAEYARGAISKTGTPGCQIEDKHSFDAWLLQNTHFAFIPCRDAQAHEKRALKRHISPLNLVHQSVPKFARQLSTWRDHYFPRPVRF